MESNLQDWLAQWDTGYRSAFADPEIRAHREALARLTSATPSALQVRPEAQDRECHCTVLTHDHPGLFALITGILGASGFSIERGECFTSRPRPSPPRPAAARRRTVPERARRMVVDCFTGRRDRRDDLESWAHAVRLHLSETLRCIESGHPDAIPQARRRVNEAVARQLAVHPPPIERALYPVRVDVENRGPYTTLTVQAQDTPFFLYALAMALALRGIRIEGVRIDTRQGQVRDVIQVLDAQGRPIVAPDRIDEARFCVLLTKQFTYFLGVAPNPSAALERFEHLAEEVFATPGRRGWMQRLSNPNTLRNLARILGASDFLWEDFIRGQHEVLRPWLEQPTGDTPLDFSAAALEARRRAALAPATDPEAFVDALNRWKDREMFRIDLGHILAPGQGARALAEPLTRLAEQVVDAAAHAAWEQIRSRYGQPRTVGGLSVPWAVFGLGKMGGVALGYASDIELLFVYGDAGETDGEPPIANPEFFERMVETFVGMIRARQEGVFVVDLRLRPYGESGPKASSLENFCRYFGSSGAARAYERLALARLRWLCGDQGLGRRIERLRDEVLYMSRTPILSDVRALREKQYAARGRSARPNAKFSAGALVDLEYCVQLLQVRYARDHARLRTPRIHEALEALEAIGVIDAEYFRRLNEAYGFLRRLINGLRMLRGNARDLELPSPDQLEYLHLARRMGYQQRHELDAGRQLTMDFAMHTAVVRTFIARHFGRFHVPDPDQGNVADLLLDAAPSERLVTHVLGRMGLRDHRRGRVNLRNLAGTGVRRERFLRLAVPAADMLGNTPDPDRALNNWDRIVAAMPDPAFHFGRLLFQPRRLEVLLALCATSQFLADTLEKNPAFFEWATDPRRLQAVHPHPQMLQLLDRFTQDSADDRQWLDAMRRFRRRELLRIGTRDLCLGAPLAVVTAEISGLADAILERWTERSLTACAPPAAGAPPAENFALFALGKLGGRELNYSSDIDILGVFVPSETNVAAPEAAYFTRVMERIRDGLSCHTREGYAYRVDVRLRPHGRAGPLISSRDGLQRYFDGTAAPWECQALLKLRPVAGNAALGAAVQADLQRRLYRPGNSEVHERDIRRLRLKRIRSAGPSGPGARGFDVKNDPGGIRDIEFIVQGLQLRHLATHPELLTGNTLDALQRLQTAGWLTTGNAERLRKHYQFLRRLEHVLQLFEDRQIHAVPDDPAAVDPIARRLLGAGADAQRLRHLIEEARRDVQEIWTFVFGDGA